MDWASVFPKTSGDELRLLTWQELWKRGFYVTSGDKFGADFLAYPGDPLLFHAKFVVQCCSAAPPPCQEDEEASLVAR